MDGVKRYGHISYLVEATLQILKLYPDMTVYVLASDFDAALAREADLQDELHLTAEERDHAKRNSSAFEERMGNLQVENGKLHDQLAELREELAIIKDECIDHMNLHKAWTKQRDGLQQRLTAAEQRNYGLVELLRIMAGDYARCLEAGYDRITFLGGDCDTVAKMLDDNPNYAKAIAACAKPTESGASE